LISPLVCGAAGFIGSHSGLVLLDADHSLLVLVNYINSSSESTRCELELATAVSSVRMARQTANPNGDAKVLHKEGGR